MFAYGLVPLENYMALEGMGIESISQAPCVYFSGETKVYTIPQAIAKVKPRRVVMTFGTNNASGQFTGSRLSMLTATRLRRFRMLTRIATSSSTQFRP